MVQMQFVPFWDPRNFLLEYPMGLKVSHLESRARNSLHVEYMIFIVLGGLVWKIWPLLGGLSFRDSLFAPTPPYFELPSHENETELRSQIRRIS